MTLCRVWRPKLYDPPPEDEGSTHLDGGADVRRRPLPPSPPLSAGASAAACRSIVESCHVHMFSWEPDDLPARRLSGCILPVECGSGGIGFGAGAIGLAATRFTKLRGTLFAWAAIEFRSSTFSPSGSGGGPGGSFLDSRPWYDAAISCSSRWEGGGGSASCSLSVGGALTVGPFQFGGGPSGGGSGDAFTPTRCPQFGGGPSG